MAAFLPTLGGKFLMDVNLDLLMVLPAGPVTRMETFKGTLRIA
jgi:hypothetical protein